MVRLLHAFASTIIVQDQQAIGQHLTNRCRVHQASILVRGEPVAVCWMSIRMPHRPVALVPRASHRIHTICRPVPLQKPNSHRERRHVLRERDDISAELVQTGLGDGHDAHLHVL